MMIRSDGRRLSLWAWYCIALGLVAISAAAQSVPSGDTADPRLVPRTKAEREARYAQHRRILLNVQVTDASGHAVKGLDVQHFKLQINHQPQAIASFQAVQDGGSTAHAHAFFVVDMLNNSVHDLSNARKAIEKLADANKQLPLPASLAILTENGMEVSGASQNASELATELGRTTRGFHPNDCTEDWNNAALGTQVAVMSVDDMNRVRDRHNTAGRIGNCLNQKYQLSFTGLLEFARDQQKESGRAILIWIGPGWPILSGPQFDSARADVRQSLFTNLVQASTQMREGQVTMDAVSWPVSSPVIKVNYRDLQTLSGQLSTEKEATPLSVAMPALAHMSGGQVYLNTKNLTAELAACLADANSYYVLGFDSEPSNAGDEFRSIQITVDSPGATVRTITEYVAP
jgi:VWFA-related protein